MDQMKIHKVISGPYDDEDEGQIWNLCLVEIEGELVEVELYYDSFDDAYEVIKHFKSSIAPLVVIIDEEDGDWSEQ